mmetsp:Transcript_3511/g.7255  ORF Transcript_3511/g.7255 Transcript_3511/m.7255 type:complete len:115 (-) Transcript_3511:1030-1374(-)
MPMHQDSKVRIWNRVNSAEGVSPKKVADGVRRTPRSQTSNKFDVSVLTQAIHKQDGTDTLQDEEKQRDPHQGLQGHRQPVGQDPQLPEPPDDAHGKEHAPDFEDAEEAEGREVH